MPKVAVLDEKGKIVAFRDTETNQYIPVETTLEQTAGPQGGIGERQTAKPDISESPRSFLDTALDFLPSLLGGTAGEITRSKTKDLFGRGLLAGGARVAGPVIAGTLGHLAGTAGVAGLRKNIPTVFGTNVPKPSISESLSEAFLDRITGRGLEAAGNTFAAYKNAGSVRNMMINKLGEILPTPAAQTGSLDEMLDFANRFDAPAPTLFGLGEGKFRGILEPSLSGRSINKLTNKIAEVENKALEAVLKSTPTSISGKLLTPARMSETPFDIATSAAQKVQSAKKILTDLEGAAHTRLDNVIEASPHQVGYYEELPVTPTGMLDQNGQPIMNILPGATLTPDGKQLVPRTKEIKGPVDIKDPKAFADVLVGEEGKLFQEPDMFFPGNVDVHARLNKVKKLVGEIAGAELDAITGRVIVPYANTKALRGALSDLLDVGRGNKQVRGAVKKIRDMLSRAETESVNDPSLNWFPGAKYTYQDAKDLTIKRDKLYSPRVADKLSTSEINPDIDPEEIFENALQSRRRAEQVVDAMGGDPTEVTLRFIQKGWDDAIKEDGTLDGKKFYDYFFEKNKSIFESSKILNKDQRTIIRQMANYAKNAKFGGGSQPGWQDARVISGLLSLGVGAGTGLVTGNWQSGIAMGAGFGIGIPMTRRFVENILLDPKGAKLLVNRLHPVSQQQSYNTTKNIIKALGRGAQVYVYDATGIGRPAIVNEKGQLEPDPSATSQ